MAQEIVVLEGNGGLQKQLLFLYPITPIDVDVIRQVPTPSADLPTIAASVMTIEEKASLDNGTSAFEVVTIEVNDTKTNNELLAEVQALYAKRLASYTELLVRKYNRAGQRLNAV